ncbi:conjugal transfer protein TraI [Pedobacter deserti]|uniref:conjugal transfer protein TraI n=1 Tax=Pedobacter deserti TaxID=2817382 RepID=UPI00210CCD33|nr:conjugal transfer protein TraI [Pedobacter sp. SYSU D00382]
MIKKLKEVLKTYMVVLSLSGTTILVALPTGANAQLAIAEVIKAGVKKVIRAVDLKVQRLQNQTIWLQNAQKVVENQLSKLKLGEISDWTERQRSLYAGYFEELHKVKAVISGYQRVKDIAATQREIIREYEWAAGLFRRDRHFSADELLYMEEVYRGILDESIRNLDQVFMVMNSFKTQMSDGARLELIDAAADKMAENYSDLKQFNQQNIMRSVSRARSELEVKSLKQVYALE